MGRTEVTKEESPPPSGTFFSFSTLTNSAAGTGILAFPYAFRCGGILGGALLSFFFAATMGWTLCLLARCCDATGSGDYQQVVAALLGPRAVKVVGLLVFLYTCKAGVATGCTLPLDETESTPRSLLRFSRCCCCCCCCCCCQHNQQGSLM